MKNTYVVYRVIYYGSRLPKYYIGSSTKRKLANGYRGSIRSRRWSDIFYDELKKYPFLFDYEILSEHNTRGDALKKELELQKKYDVVKSDLYFNEAYAAKNGCHGRNVNGRNNPMYGRRDEVIAINKTTGEKVRVDKRYFETNANLEGHTAGFIYVIPKKSKHKKCVAITREEYANNKCLYTHLNSGRKASELTRKKLSTQRAGLITVKDIDGNYYRVNKDDERIRSGELANATSKKWLLKSPNGAIYKTISLKVFCRLNRLDIVEYVEIENGIKRYKMKIRERATKQMWELFEIK